MTNEWVICLECGGVCVMRTTVSKEPRSISGVFNEQVLMCTACRRVWRDPSGYATITDDEAKEALLLKAKGKRDETR